MGIRMYMNSKDILANSFMELAKHTPLGSITVQDIVNNCGAGRQTFYNHFKDKYDLMNWIYKTNARRIWTMFISSEPWNKVLSRIMDHMLENKNFYLRACNTEGQNSFFEYLYEDIRNSCIKVCKKNLKTNVIADDILFSIEFYCFGATNMVKQWVKKGMKEPTGLVASNICRNMPEDFKKLIELQGK